MPNLLDIRKEKHSYLFRVDDKEYKVTLTGRVYIDDIEVETSINESSYICFKINDEVITVSDILYQCSNWLRKNGGNEDK